MELLWPHQANPHRPSFLGGQFSNEEIYNAHNEGYKLWNFCNFVIVLEREYISITKQIYHLLNFTAEKSFTTTFDQKHPCPVRGEVSRVLLAMI